MSIDSSSSPQQFYLPIYLLILQLSRRWARPKKEHQAPTNVINVGIKHDFLCINICWAPREVLKPEHERQGFQHLPRAQQMLMYQKSMFDRYYCIKTLCFLPLSLFFFPFFFSFTDDDVRFYYLVNRWICAGKNVAVNNARHSFLCNKMF